MAQQPHILVTKMSSLDLTDLEDNASRINHPARTVLVPALKREEYTVGWICALPIELAAGSAMFDVRHESLPQLPNDFNVYLYGSMCGHNIVIACLPSGEYGTTSATSVAKDMLRSFSIRIGLMVGIGGGVPKHGVHLGDVVISKPGLKFGGVVQYDFGKAMIDGKFIRTGHLNSPPRSLLIALSSLESEIEMFGDQSHIHLQELSKKYPHMKDEYASPEMLRDVVFKAEDEHSGSGSCELCLSHFTPLEQSTGARVRKVHCGLIASGNQVMKDAKRRDSLSNEMGESVLCFEMEAAGLMNDFPCLIIKGICDYSDSHKNKDWQRYAAAVAAAEAKQLLRHLAREAVWQPTAVSLQKVHWVVPFLRNENFVGREDQLIEIMDKLALESSTTIGHRVALSGLGGIGKTQLALETAWLIREKSLGCSVFWVSAVSSTSFNAAYRQIGQELNVVGIDDDKADVQSLVKAHLSREDTGRWLLIVDNADNLNALYKGPDGSNQSSTSLPLADSLPVSRYGSIILTTRNHQVAVRHAGNNVVTVREMSGIDSVKLLQESLITNAPSSASSPMELVKLLTYLPLAIKQAAAYINEQQESVDGYLDLCQSSDQELIEVLSQDFEDHGRYERTTNPIALTWLISFHQIQRDEPLAAEYLCFMSCVARQDIPQPLLPTASKIQQSKAIGILKAYAFITSREGGKSYDMHRLVQLSVRNWLESQGQLRRWSCVALKKVEEMFPFYQHENRDVCTLYIPHAQCVFNFSDFSDFSDDMRHSRAVLAYNIGEYFLQTGKYSEAESKYCQALELLKVAYSDTDVGLLDIMNNLAVVYRYLEKYVEAESLQQQTLELKRTSLGSTHTATLDSMNNLAIVYQSQGKYAEAETLQQQTLELKRTSLGSTHPATLDSMNNLAIVYQSQGKYAEAESLQQQTLKLQRESLGSTHTATLDSMNNLAVIYQSQGKYAEAEALHQQTLKLRLVVLGHTHPSTLESTNNLANLYYYQGRYAEAETLQKQTIELSRTMLGNTHPSTRKGMKILAKTYDKLGKNAEADALKQEISAANAKSQLAMPSVPETGAQDSEAPPQTQANLSSQDIAQQSNPTGEPTDGQKGSKKRSNDLIS